MFKKNDHVIVVDSGGFTITESSVKRVRVNRKNGSRRYQVHHPVYGHRWFAEAMLRTWEPDF